MFSITTTKTTFIYEQITRDRAIDVSRAIEVTNDLVAADNEQIVVVIFRLNGELARLAGNDLKH